jgi:hypothetical protein
LNTFQKYLKKLGKQKASNIKVVVLCVVAATTFWILNALNKDNYTTVVDQPIEFYYNREEFMAVEPLPTKIQIEVNGNGWDLLRKQFNVNVVPFPIELTDPSAQDYLLPASFQRALAEQTVPTQLTAILEDTLRIRIDKVVEERLKVMLDTAVNPLAENIRFASDVKIQPDCVTMTGPTSIIAKLGGMLLVDIDQKGLNENFSKTIPLSLPEEHETFLTLAEKEVAVSFEVVEFLAGQRVVTLRQLNFPSSVSLAGRDSIVVMQYLLDERQTAAFSDVDLEAVVNYNTRNREDSTVTVTLRRAPDYLDSVRFVPATFKLEYE